MINTLYVLSKIQVGKERGSCAVARTAGELVYTTIFFDSRQSREVTFHDCRVGLCTQRSVSSMPGVTFTFVLADGPGDGLRNPVSTVTGFSDRT